MSDKPKAFFGGLWAPIREQMTTPVRPAILFLGDCYFVRFHLDPSDKTLHIDSRTYVVDGDWVHHGSMNPEEEEEDDMISFRWRLADKGRLEFEENDRNTIWEPVLAEDMAAEGYPKAVFDRYRSAYAKEGHAFTIEGLVPDIGSFDKP